MSPNEFMDAVRTVVVDAAANDTVATLARPPGRRPPADLVALANWYQSLDTAARDNVARVATLTARATAFGFTAVLDGSRVVTGPGPKGHFELVYVSPDGQREPLAGPDGAILHDLL